MLASGYNSTTTYAYDPTGARVLQTSTTSTTYYPNKYYSFASTKIGANTYATSTNYVWNGDTLLATIDQPMINGTATGTAITRYIHPDHLGSTNVVTDQSGNLVQLMDYYPYGATRIATSTYPTNEKRRYIGQFSDAQTSLNYLNARYYDGNRGQFLSEDPNFITIASGYANPQRYNAYSYGRDNPIAFLDNTGFDSAYFASRPVLFVGRHIYEAYSIDAQSVANQLNIGVPTPNNVSKDNPFNFTLGFEPSDPDRAYGTGTGSNLILSVESGYGNSFPMGGGDYKDASSHGFSSAYGQLSLGIYANYAQLANASVKAGAIISAGQTPYFGLGDILYAITLRNYTNSNGAMHTVAMSTGQTSQFNQVAGGVGMAAVPGKSDVISGGQSISGGTTLIGNSMGPFIGTYNFGPGVGTYDFGKQSWVK
jgi:RHS repeat-associated protein